jgi:hypothetical protein
MAVSLSQLAKIRETIANTGQQLRLIDAAELPKEDAEDRVAALVHNLATKFDADFVGRAIVSGQGAISVSDILAAAETESDPAEKLLVTMAWLQPELLMAKLMSAAQPFFATGKTALPIAERPALARKLDKRLHDLAVEEEAMVRELEAAGHDVWRRPEVDPLVVLGI